MHENQSLLAQVELMLEDMNTPQIKSLQKKHGDDAQVKICMALKDKYSFLNKNYPQIFLAVARGEMNLDIFKMMLDARKRIGDGELEQDEADKQIGTFLYNKFTTKM